MVCEIGERRDCKGPAGRVLVWDIAVGIERKRWMGCGSLQRRLDKARNP